MQSLIMFFRKFRLFKRMNIMEESLIATIKHISEIEEKMEWFHDIRQKNIADLETKINNAITTHEKKESEKMRLLIDQYRS